MSDSNFVNIFKVKHKYGALKFYFVFLIFCMVSSFLVSRFQDIILSERIEHQLDWVIFWLTVGLLGKSLYLYSDIKERFEHARRAGQTLPILKSPALFIAILLPFEFFAIYSFTTDTIPITYTKISGNETEQILVINKAGKTRRAVFSCSRYYRLSGLPWWQNQVCAKDKSIWLRIRANQGTNAYCKITAVGIESEFGFVPERLEKIPGQSSGSRPHNC